MAKKIVPPARPAVGTRDAAQKPESTFTEYLAAANAARGADPLIAASDIVKRVEAQRDRIFAAMSIINLAEHASPGDVRLGEPEVRSALHEAYGILDDAVGKLDPWHFEVRNAEEVAHD